MKIIEEAFYIIITALVMIIVILLAMLAFDLARAEGGGVFLPLIYRDAPVTPSPTLKPTRTPTPPPTPTPTPILAEGGNSCAYILGAGRSAEGENEYLPLVRFC